MSGRAGYTLVVYVIDVSPSMGEPKADPAGSGVKLTRLDWAKEYVARQLEPKIQNGRKTECVGLVSFGGRTNNQANRAWIQQNPDDEDEPYAAVSSDAAIQTAKPKVLEVLLNLGVGESEGNPVSGIVVSLDMIAQHKHSKSWTLEIVLITDGESAFQQDEYEEAMERLDDLGVQLSVIGVDFQDPELPVEKDKSRNKRLSEKFWRIFIKQLREKIETTSDFEKFMPRLAVFDSELIDARRPHPAVVNGTVSGTTLFIGASGWDEAQAIKIPIKYSKSTMKARPPTLSKAWKTAVELQQPPNQFKGTEASQIVSSLAEQSQSQHQNAPVASDIAAMVSGDVKRHNMYFIARKPDASLPPTQATQGDSQMPPTQEEEEEMEQEFVDKEDLVKAWRFGSSWVPVEEDTFEPLQTQKGVEVIGFMRQKSVRKYMLIGEVRYMWPDMTSPRAQIQWSSFVRALLITGRVPVVRWVNKDNAAPDIGVCIPLQDYPAEDKTLELMYWIKLPFADDEHKFWFPSLTKYKTTSGVEVTEHPYIPTKEQCDLMDSLVEGLDLDVPPPKAEKDKGSDDEDEDEDEDEDMEDEEPYKWFSPANSYNPVIHRIKEAIFHASVVEDLEAAPLGPPHPEIVKFFHTPEYVAAKADKVTEQLKEALNIKKVPPRTRKRVNREGLREDEGYIDIDALFDDGPAATLSGTLPDTTLENKETQDEKPKSELLSPAKPKIDAETKPVASPARSKPKAGRLVSNEKPLEDFNRLVQGEGDVFRKAIQDLGEVVKENVAASFSHSAFPLALQCLEEMRKTALIYEETETYNDIVDSLQKTVKGKGFKHPDFWDHFEKADNKVSRISQEEAAEALEDYD